jgi:NADH:ubiquinone oxidoreductase subunit C
MTKQKTLHDALRAVWPASELELIDAFGELTAVISTDALLSVMTQLRDHADFEFNQLIDVCGVDYLHYGLAQWETDAASSNGFSRAVERQALDCETSETQSKSEAQCVLPWFIIYYQPPKIIVCALKFIWMKCYRLWHRLTLFGEVQIGLSVKRTICLVFYLKDILI